MESQEQELVTLKEFVNKQKAQLKIANQQMCNGHAMLTLARKQIVQMKNKLQQFVRGEACYIAHKEDPVDVKLADFINNNYQDKMRILFLRESEGVYQFGSRRVYLKIDKGEQIKVRIGGGYMLIDQFIEKFSTSEIQKIERRNLIQRFQTKLQIQNVSTNVEDIKK